MAPQELSVFRIPPYHYIHVLDQTTNVTRLEVGPATFVRKDNETVVSGPQRMVTVPPRHYCVVLNPVMRDQDGQILLDAVGQVSYLVTANNTNQIQNTGASCDSKLSTLFFGCKR